MDDRLKRRQQQSGTSRLGGTGKLPRQPQEPPQQASAPQANPFVVRLDPHSQPGEFNFMIETPPEITRKVPASGHTQETAGGIPPQLHPAVLDVLGFIFELDQNFERKARKR